MKLSSQIKVCLIVSVAYIAFGDLFLPRPYGNNSQQIKADMNQYLLGLFPSEKLKGVKQQRSSLERVREIESGSLNSPF